MHLKFTLVAIVSIAAITNVQSQERRVKTAAGLIEAMYNMYKGNWYSTLAFTQQTSFYKNGVLDREQTWYEVMDMSGGLVIKFDEMASGNGMMFKSDSQYVFKDNILISRARKVHDLIVLGFSVYVESPNITIAKLKESGYNFEFFKEETNNDSTSYVVGDPNVAQFWIDSKTLLFTRSKKKLKDGGFAEIYFKKYQKLGKGWIENEVIFYKNGQITLKEVYRDIKIPKSIPSNLFDLIDFKSKKW